MIKRALNDQQSNDAPTQLCTSRSEIVTRFWRRRSERCRPCERKDPYAAAPRRSAEGKYFRPAKDDRGYGSLRSQGRRM